MTNTRRARGTMSEEAFSLMLVAVIVLLSAAAVIMASDLLQRRHRYEQEIDLDGYDAVMEMIQRHPSLSGTANHMAVTDGIVTRDEFDALSMQAEAIRRDREMTATHGMQ